MRIIRLEAAVEELFEGAETAEEIATSVYKMVSYLEDAFKCEVTKNWQPGDKYVKYYLHELLDSQADAIMELLGMFTLFDTKEYFND